FLTLIIGIWTAYRLYPLLLDTRLHKARFARLDEMETLFSKKPCHDGLVLGRVRQFLLFHHYVCVRPTKTKKEIGNSLIIGPTGMGKGNMIESQILAWKESIMINDIKGDLFVKTAGYRATLGPVYVIDPTRGRGQSVNPLHGKTTEDAYLSVARNLVYDPNDRDPFFAESASLMIMRLFQAARLEGIAPLVYLRHMIHLGLPAVAKRLDSLDPKIATSFLGANFHEANLDNRTLTSVWSTLATRLTPFLTETLVRCFTRSDVTAETIMRGEKPVTVYFRFEEGELERLSPLVRVLWGSQVKELIACFDRAEGKGCRPVLLSIDEAGRTPIPSLAGHVATIRSRGIFAQLYAQSFAQLEQNYDAKNAQTISANMDTHVFLRPNDQETARSIEEWLGKGSKYAHSYNMRVENELNEGLSEQATPVMTARAIMEMHEKYALLFHRDFPPMKVLRLKWWQSKMLKKRHSMPVPQLPTLPAVPDLEPASFVPVQDMPRTTNGYIDPDILLTRTKETEFIQEPL
ncbi:MAG: type IV secretory system conjugative DNA transfer family protein, partial [Ktedonobacteraceae bacterium]